MGTSSDNHKVRRWAARLAAGKSATTIMLLNEVIATKLAEAVRKRAQQPSAHALLHFGEGLLIEPVAARKMTRPRRRSRTRRR
jgi:hypothetical protein